MHAKVVLVIVTALSMGCIKDMQADIKKQEAQVAVLHKKLEADRKELEALLGEASRVVRRNSADQGVQVEELQKRVDELQGLVAEFQNTAMVNDAKQSDRYQVLQSQLTEIARAAGVDLAAQAGEVPSDKKKHFNAATQALRIGEHSFARALFREFVKKYPKDRLADDAQYWLGVSYLRQERPAQALGEFKKVLSDYPKGDMLDETLYDMADAFFQVRACTDAKNALNALLKKYKRSSLAPKARKKLRQINAAGKRACES